MSNRAYINPTQPMFGNQMRNGKKILNAGQTLSSSCLRDIRECHQKSAKWDRISLEISLVALGFFVVLSCRLSPFYLIPAAFCGLYAHEKRKIAELREENTADTAPSVHLAGFDDKKDHSLIGSEPRPLGYFDKYWQKEMEILRETETLESPRLDQIREGHRKSAEWDRTSSKIGLVALGVFVFLSCLLSPFYLIPAAFCGLYAHEKRKIAERKKEIIENRKLLVDLVHSDDEQDRHRSIISKPATRNYLCSGLILHGWF